MSGCHTEMGGSTGLSSQENDEGKCEKREKTRRFKTFSELFCLHVTQEEGAVKMQQWTSTGLSQCTGSQDAHIYYEKFSGKSVRDHS